MSHRVRVRIRVLRDAWPIRSPSSFLLSFCSDTVCRPSLLHHVYLPAGSISSLTPMTDVHNHPLSSSSCPIHLFPFLFFPFPKFTFCRQKIRSPLPPPHNGGGRQQKKYEIASSSCIIQSFSLKFHIIFNFLFRSKWSNSPKKNMNECLSIHFIFFFFLMYLQKAKEPKK